MRALQFIYFLLNLKYIWGRSAFYFSNRPPLRRSGYYEPNPPDPRNTVVYSFSPVEEDDMKRYGHRNTRDINWPGDSEEDRRLIEKFNNFQNDEEPSCEELRRMWRLAKKLQERSSSEISPFMYSTATPSKSPELNKEESKGLLLPSPNKMKTDRRRLSVVPSRPSSFSKDDPVFGKIRRLQPRIQVHDPTNDIYNILRSRKEKQIKKMKSLRMRATQNAIQHYGKVQYQENPASSTNSPYIDRIRNKLREEKGLSPIQQQSEESQFDGLLVQRPPEASSIRPFDKLRLQILAERAKNKDQGTDDEDLEKAAALEIIRERLMSARANQRMIDSNRKGLRRKNSKKRRRNVEEVELRREIMRNIYNRILQEGKRRNRRNRKAYRSRRYRNKLRREMRIKDEEKMGLKEV